MKKRIFSLIIIANFALMLSGCTNRTTDQVELRDRGIIEIENNNYDEAINLFNQALARSVGRVTKLELDIDYYKAAAQFRAKYYGDAISTYTAIIKYDPNNFEAYFLRGCVYAATDEITKACEDYNKAIECDKKNYELYLEIYDNLISLGYEGEANVYINKVLNIEDKSPTASYYKGRVNYILGQYSDAEPLLKKAIEKNVVEAKLYLAKLYQDSGETDTAKSLLEEYASSDGVNSEAMAALGDIEMSKEEYRTALDYYDAGLGLENVTNYPQLIKGKVSALEHLHKYGDAREALTQYLESYPEDEEAKNELIFLESR